MKILFFGDSITDMGHNRNEDNTVFSYGSAYPFFVAGELLAEDPNNTTVINRGISGNRVVDLYARIKIDVWNERPDVLGILIGINDIWHEINRRNGVELDRYEHIYRMMLEETIERLPHTRILLMEPFVLHGSATDEHFEEFSKVRQYAKVVKKLADELHLDFVPLQDAFDEKAAQYGPQGFLYDGVHPMVAGAKLIADQWLKVFREK